MLPKNTNNSLERLLFSRACLIGSVLGFIAFIVNTLLIDNPLMAISTGIAAVAMLLLYFYAQNKENLFPSTLIFIFISLSAINICWFATDGLDGAAPFVFIILAVVITSLISLKYYGYFIGLIASNILLLVYIESKFPHLIIPYIDKPTHEIDILISIFNALILTTLAVLFFKKGFLKKQTQILAKNIELEESKKELEAAKGKAEEASQIKSDFLATMSHEIRTPLNAIVGIANLLQQYDYENMKKVELIQALNLSSQNLLKLLNDILDFNKIELGQANLLQQEIDLRNSLAVLIQNFKEKALANGNQLLLKIEPNVPSLLLIDNYRLHQILGNLLSNSIKFTQNGKIEVQVKLIKKDSNMAQLLFEVIDTGVGISKNQQHLIFDKFTQANVTQALLQEGTGLGLAIVSGLLKLMDSSIHVESQLGEGATFHFTLNCPISDGEPVKDLQPILENTITSPSNKILLVEDNKTNILVLTHFLKQWNIPYEIAYNGLEALDYFNQESFQLILMDMQMPEMDGFEATEKIRRTNGLIPIIALTASATVHERERAVSAGVNEYITKPFDPKHLFKVIQKHLVA